MSSRWTRTKKQSLSIWKNDIFNGPKLLNQPKSTRPWILSTYVYTYTCYSIYVYVYIHRCTATTHVARSNDQGSANSWMTPTNVPQLPTFGRAHLSHVQSWLPRTNLVLEETNNQFPVDDSGLTDCVVFVHTWNAWAISEILPRHPSVGCNLLKNASNNHILSSVSNEVLWKDRRFPRKLLNLQLMPCSDLGGGWTAGLNNQQSELPMLQWSPSRGENQSWFETATSFSC